MPEKRDEAHLLWIAVGIVFFSVLAIAVFLLNVQVLFYISALLAIVLGFYLSRSLSRLERERQQQPKKGK